MRTMVLRVTLKSAATFGRGDGVAGLVDREIEYDEDGFPCMRGKTLKGLLAESAENVLYSLELQGKPEWRADKDSLFGRPGRGLSERGIIHIGDARLPSSLRLLIESEYEDSRLAREDILRAFTNVRHQTAMNPEGGPEHKTLRTMRVLLRGVVLESEISFEAEPSARQLAFLAASVLDLRQAGTGRNRGRGWIKVELEDEKTTRDLFLKFAGEVKG